MKALKDVIKHASAIAFEENTDQKIGIANEDWVIRSWDDPVTLQNEIRINSSGVNPNFLNVPGGVDEDWNLIT